MRAEVPFHHSTIGIFIVYQDGLETNLLQLFAYLENSEWFSVTIFCAIKLSIALNTSTAPLPYRCSGVPGVWDKLIPPQYPHLKWSLEHVPLSWSLEHVPDL